MKNKGLARRNFIKYGSALAAGTLVSTPLIGSLGKTENKEKKFIYRKLGNTGLELPIVSMGVMRADNPQLIEAALNAGIKHFDTAAVYQNGKNEEMLGKILKNYPRESFTIGTKIHAGKFNAYDNKEGILKDNITEGFNEELKGCLQRLQMDYVDILYIHAIEHAHVAFDERLLKIMQQAKDEGKTKFLGISTHNQKDILKAVIEKGFYDVVLIGINFKHADDREYIDLIKTASEKGIGIIAMKTMMGGFLDQQRTKKVNGKAALKWVMKNEYIHTSIPGLKSYEELDINLSVMENLELDEQEKSDLELAFNETGLYCTGCKECIPQCKKGLAIPELMRAYMYAYGYGETKKAQEQFTAYKISKMCNECDVCTVSCPKGFNVNERIRDISRIENTPTDFLV